MAERGLSYLQAHPEVNALIQEVLTGVRGAIGEQLVGFYLHGSLAAGDFDPARSDIDFAVVTQSELSAQQVEALAGMHAAIGARGGPWVANYEGSYIPRDAIRRNDPANSTHPVLSIGGRFGLEEHGLGWLIQRHVLREHGVALVGPPPHTLIDPISPDQLRQASRQILEGWWRPQLADPSEITTSEYQAYTVLTMCRALYTEATGLIGTKPEAARWALTALDHQWADLIEQAMAWRHGLELNRLEEVLALLRFTLDAAATGFAPA